MEDNDVRSGKMMNEEDEKEGELVEGSGDEWSWSIRDYKDSKPLSQPALDGDLDQRPLWVVGSTKERDNSTGYKMEKEWHSEKKIWMLYFCLILCFF